MRRNESQLLAWLADTANFPVTPHNMLVKGMRHEPLDKSERPLKSIHSL